MHIGNYLRLVAVISVDYSNNQMETIWIDTGERGPTMSIPHPFAGLGEGVFVGIRPGTLVVVDRASYERYIPLATVPMSAYSSVDIGSLDDISIDAIPFPSIDAGEIYIQSSATSGIHLDNFGNIQMFNPFGEGQFLGGSGDHSTRVGINSLPPTQYIVSNAGLIVNGLVKRDVNLESQQEWELVSDPMTDPSYEQFLEEVGKDPSKSVELMSSDQQSSAKEVNIKNFRNPGFVENRQIVLEYGRDWAVLDRANELKRLKEGILSTKDPTNRSERRNNVLGLSLNNPNELIEIIYGTLIDFFGNPLDLNKAKIPKISYKSEEEYYDRLEDNARKTVAFLKEINTRKGYSYRSDGLVPKDLKGAPDVSTTENNSRDRSKWSIIVDKEGVTKLNIPASSETGNVPVLARAENSSSVAIDSDGNPKKTKSDDPLAVYRNEKKIQDIHLDQVGPGGIIVSGQKYNNRLAKENAGWVDKTLKKQPDVIQAGTAFHDITKTAASLLEKDANRIGADVSAESPPSVTPDGPAVNSTIDNIKPSKTPIASIRDESGRIKNCPNAGGRSVQANLDGSLELSIGANTVDRVSWILDTAGGIVTRLGRDRYGRSAVIQADGSVYLEVGGYDYIGENSSDKTDTRFAGGGAARSVALKKDPTQFRAGRVVVKIKGNSTGTADQTIIIDESGITLDSTKRININSKGDIIIKSKACITLDAPRVKIFKDDMAREIIRSQRPLT